MRRGKIVMGWTANLSFRGCRGAVPCFCEFPPDEPKGPFRHERIRSFPLHRSRIFAGQRSVNSAAPPAFNQRNPFTSTCRAFTP